MDNLGILGDEGRAAGLLEIQMVADACGCEIDIVNYGAEGKNFSVSPDGKTSTKIQVIYTTSEDGTNRVSLMGPIAKRSNCLPTWKDLRQPLIAAFTKPSHKRVDARSITAVERCKSARHEQQTDPIFVQ